jgi:hypothetical protein
MTIHQQIETYLDDGKGRNQVLYKIRKHVAANQRWQQYLIHFATAYLVDDAMRKRQLATERASVVVEMPGPTEGQAERAGRERDFQRIYADPSQLNEITPGPNSIFLCNIDIRKKFHSWCGNRARGHKAGDYEDWYRRAQQAAKKSPDPAWARRQLRNSFNPHDRSCWDYDALLHKMASELPDTLERYRQEIRLEITQELLEEEFALGDGRKVTWGRATVLQHTTRIDLLKKNIVGNMSAAIRHQAAIDMIKKHRVTCLGKIQTQPPKSNAKSA